MDGVDVGLEEGVTDSGLQSLASAGCGAQLTSLTLVGEWYCVVILEMCCGICVAMH